MRHRIPSLLSLLCLVRVCTGWTAAGAAEPNAACEAMAQKALDLSAFRQVVEAFANLRAQPEAASALLVCLLRGNRELAETLMLHQRRLLDPARDDAEVERAFLHYVNNTTAPKLADRETADLDRLARTYRQSLLLTDESDVDSAASCAGRPSMLTRLRCLGQRANHERYGRGDVVPVNLLDFDASAASYSTVDATWMAEMSALAYWDSKLIGQQLGRWGYERVAQIVDRRTDTHAFLAARDKVLVLSFRGTSGFKNFLTDGNIRRVRADWVQGSVHAGFKSALDAVWPQIVSKLGPHEPQQKEIWLTGHSLGAALAQLAALRLTEEGYRVHSVYTFGTPRMGDKDFVASYDRRLGAQTFPHINSQDVVTRAPPEVLGFRATAGANTRKFFGAGHEMKLAGELVEDADAPADWRRRVRQSISKTTAFLPEALRPAALRSTPPAAPPPVNLYSTGFERGPLDDHGSFEYLFKLVCASIEYDLWPREIRQSNKKVEDARQK